MESNTEEQHNTQAHKSKDENKNIDGVGEVLK